jgi:hypothetical protein
MWRGFEMQMLKDFWNWGYEVSDKTLSEVKVKDAFWLWVWFQICSTISLVIWGLILR